MSVLTDPIGDLLTRIRNAQHAKRPQCTAPWSRIKEELCTLLREEGWIADVTLLGEPPKREIAVTLLPGKHLTIARVSKPGRRIYRKSGDLKPVLQGFGIAVLTTSGGLMTDREARKRKIGGEVLCTIS